MTFLASKAQLRASFLRWALFLVPLIALLGFLSGQVGTPDTAWFEGLTKPSIFPPSAAFGIVWSILYIMIGLSLALIASSWGAHGRRLALGLFVVHFAFNLSWHAVFFAAQNIVGGLWVLAGTIVTLLIVIWAFWRVRKLAALLLLPYLAWVLFATVLNYQFLAENPDGGDQNASGAAQRIEL